MSSTLAAEFLFWAQIISGIASLIFICTWLRKQFSSWREALKMKLPVIALGLMVISILSGVFGLWVMPKKQTPPKPCPEPQKCLALVAPAPASASPKPKEHPKTPQSSVAQQGAGNQQTVTHAPVTQSNSGGCNQQVIGGNNNTNNCIPPARTLTNLQRSNIATAIADVPPSIEIVVSHADSGEAQDFAAEILKIVQSVHPLSHDGFYYSSHFKGVFVAINSSDDVAAWPAQKLGFALDNNGLALQTKAITIDPKEVPAGKIYIFVGEQ